MAIVISDKTKPPLVSSIPSVFKYERGLDPWHKDAFTEELQEQTPRQGERRKGGWFALDYWGNAIGFIPDGTVIED